MGERRAERDAAAEPDDRGARRIRMEQQRHVREHRCVNMSPAFDASTLPSIASEMVPVSRRTVTVPVEPSRYDSRSPAVSARLEIRAAHGRRVLVGAARQQRAVPLRRRSRGDQHGDRAARPNQSTAAARARRSDRMRDRRRRAQIAATIRIVACSPISGISTNPASSEPRIAPSVLIA